MKKILTIHYSQSGQLTEIVNQYCSGIENASFEHVRISPKYPFPFPWTNDVFFDIMPDTVLENAIELAPFSLQENTYDLIILAYQPWFLSPSMPITALLKKESFQKIIKDTPIVTLIGSRNMWLNSQESIKKLILDAGGKLVGNVPLIDRNPNLLSVISILHWMQTGKKTKKWGIFPKPGISNEDIVEVKKFGVLLNSEFESTNFSGYQEKVVENGGVTIPTNILFIEGKAKRIFRIWANLIQKKTAAGGNRKFWVNFFKYYLLFALFIVSPILLLIYFVLIYPFTIAKVKAKKSYYQGVKFHN
jgi:hypothetical protein